MKRCLGVILALVLVLAGIPALSGSRGNVKAADSDYLDGSAVAGEFWISGYNGAGGALSIPDTIGGKKVTKILPGAFKSNTSISSVVIPGSVTEIGDEAFANTDISSLVIPDSVQTIGQKAFYNTAALSSVTTGGGLTKVGAQAFALGVSETKSISSFSSSSVRTQWAEDTFEGRTIDLLTVRQDSDLYTLLYGGTVVKDTKFTGAWLSETEAEIGVGSTYQLTVNDNSAPVTYSAVDPAVAQVSETGVVTGLKPGATRINASIVSDTFRGTLSCRITVTDLVISPKKATITEGFSKTLKLAGADKVTWSSSDEGIASVSPSGKVKGVKAGKAVITAKAGSVTYTCPVTVKANKCTVSRYSKNARRYSSGYIAFATVQRMGSDYIIRGHFMNGTGNKIKSIRNLTLTVKSGKKTIAKKTYKKVKLNVKPYGTKKLTFRLSGKSVKKNADLRKKKATVSIGRNARFVSTRTRVVTKTTITHSDGTTEVTVE